MLAICSVGRFLWYTPRLKMYTLLIDSTKHVSFAVTLLLCPLCLLVFVREKNWNYKLINKSTPDCTTYCASLISFHPIPFHPIPFIYPTLALLLCLYGFFLTFLSFLYSSPLLILYHYYYIIKFNLSQL